MGEGLGQRPRRRWRPSTSRALRLDEVLAAARARRDERRGHGRPPRALPARPGRAALVDRDAAARVRPGARTCTTRTRTASTCSPARATASGWSPSASATRPRGSRTSGPASPWPSRSALAVRENPELKLVVLAKHGLVVWGDSAEEAYRRTIEVINRAVDFVNARDRRRAALRRRQRRTGRGRARAAARAAARDARRGVERARQGARRSTPRPRALEFVSSSAAPSCSDGRRARARTTSSTPSASRCGSRSTRHRGR